MPSLALTARRWVQAGEPAVLVEVVASRGSAPRDAGTRMLVSAGEVAGTIGGGHLEWRAIADARLLLRHGAAEPGPTLEQHIALGPSLGQCCGGVMDLRFERLAAHHVAAWPPPRPRFHLQLYGAGHVGRAIVALLDTIDCRVQWIDEREIEFPRDRREGLHIERLCVEPVQAEVALAPPGAFYLVLTHSHDLDLAVAETILRRGDFGFFGLIGSRTKRARFVRRFRQRGLPPEAIARMTCPIGLPGIPGKEPEVLAIAAVAQLLQVQAGAMAPGPATTRQGVADGAAGR